MTQINPRPPWLHVALKDVGYHEKPGNDNKFGRALGLNKVPWCDLAVTRWCQLSKHPLPSMQPGMSTGAASVWYSMRYAQANGLWLSSWDAKPGDQIVYGWQGPGSPPAEMHTGLIVRSGAQGSTGHTVEGNRGDQVGRFTFTVGESVVLGCIDLNRLLLGRPKVVVKPKPDPQPRNPHHPAHTGPSPSKSSHADAAAIAKKRQDSLAQAVAGHNRALRRFGITTHNTEAENVNVILTYAKAHVALVGSAATWALSTFPPSTQEYHVVAALVAVLTALGVLKVPNKRKPRKSNTGV